MIELTQETSSLRNITRLGKQGSRLLHAQCWAWGRDIKHEGGNLMLRYGFERLRPPAGLSGCSQYTLLTGDLIVRLWGFGVYIGREQGIYLNRYEFIPRCATLANAWTPAQLARGRRCFDAALLSAFLAWVSRYEVWVEETQGRDYRRLILLGFDNTRPESLDLAVEWLSLKEAIEQAAGVRGAPSQILEQAASGRSLPHCERGSAACTTS